MVVSKGKARFEFRHVDGGRHLIVDYPAFDGGRGLHADLYLASPADDRMVIATPFRGVPFVLLQPEDQLPAPLPGPCESGSTTSHFARKTRSAFSIGAGESGLTTTLVLGFCIRTGERRAVRIQHRLRLR